MSPFTLAQKLKAAVACVGSIATTVAALAAYLATQELVNEDARALAATVAGAAGLVAATATYVLTYRVENAPITDGPPPLTQIEGTH